MTASLVRGQAVMKMMAALDMAARSRRARSKPLSGPIMTSQTMQQGCMTGAASSSTAGSQQAIAARLCRHSMRAIEAARS